MTEYKWSDSLGDNKLFVKFVSNQSAQEVFFPATVEAVIEALNHVSHEDRLAVCSKLIGYCDNETALAEQRAVIAALTAQLQEREKQLLSFNERLNESQEKALVSVVDKFYGYCGSMRYILGAAGVY